MSTFVARASESLHWYGKDGSPQYSVKAKDGSDRPTTLKDARKMGLVPSVTTIMNCAAKPGLEAWKLNQMLLAALTLPRAPEESEDSYVKRIVSDSKEHAKAAAERGTEVHAALEKWYEGVLIAPFAEHQMGVAEAVKQQFGDCNWESEKSFAHQLGFGGKTDLFTRDGDGVVLDFKTKEFTSQTMGKVEAYDEHAMQLSAYRQGLNLPKARCANVFVSVTEPGLVKIVEWAEEDIKRGWAMFDALRQYWYAKTGL